MFILKEKLGVVLALCFTILILLLIIFSMQESIALATENPGLSESAQTGKEIFNEVNCLMCHMLNGEGGGLEDAPDLAGVSSRKKPGEINEWLKKHLYEEPRISMFEEEPTDQNISNLADYLSTL